MRNFILIIFSLFSLLIFGGCTGVIKQADEKMISTIDGEKPNIIFILTDDQRWDAVGYAGNDIIHTPHLDKLAGEGLIFDNAFVTTPICAASRASFLTGLYERTHDYTFGKPPLNNEYMYESYPYLLREAGYKTGFVGKLGVKLNEGIEDSLFDSSKKTSWPYLREIDGKNVHLADINGNHAIDFIKSSKDKPFCLSLSFWSPHADDGAEEQYFWPEYTDNLYADTEIPVPATADPAFFEALPEYLKTTMNRKRWYWRYDTPEKYQKMVKGYYRMISGIDSVIARIRHTLEEEGLSDNTVIIFMGDNGYFLGERGYAGKWLMYEQSIRVPLVIYDPRQPEAKRSKRYDEMVLNVDVTPTILELAGVERPKRYHGESLTAFFNDKPEQWRDGAFFEHRLKNRPILLPKTEAYRDETWKFIRYEDRPDLMELYNFKEDINETRNLAYQPEYSDKVVHYRKICDSISNKLSEDRVNN